MNKWRKWVLPCICLLLAFVLAKSELVIVALCLAALAGMGLAESLRER